ncbi:MAG: cation diffusion facilitator family transporter [Candidatus Omnitrophota bacterium]
MLKKVFKKIMRVDCGHHHAHMSAQLYSREVKKTLWRVLFLNWFVAFAKLALGYCIKSTSLLADGYHSLADGASNIIGLLGMRIASQPKDKDHPYGHKKYETFTSIFIAFLLFFVCFHILHDSLERLKTSQAPHVTVFSFVVLGVTMLINIIVMVYEYRRGKRLKSDILIADSMHTRADIMTSLSVIFALIGVILGYPFLDAIVALAITCFIGFSAVSILKSTSKVLCDTAVIDPRQIEAFVLEVPGVKKCHKIRTRGRRDDVYIDLHVLMDDKMLLVDAHEVSFQIEKLIKKTFSGVADVIVHIEPLSSDGRHEE